MTNKRRYPIGHMDMLGEVFTPSKYVLMALEENNHEFIRIPKLFYPKKTYYEVGCKIERSYKGYYLVPHKDVDIYYILFVLNSPFSNYFLTSDKKVSYYSVNLNLLSQYPMPIVDKTHQIACAYLEKIIYEMHRVVEKQDHGDRDRNPVYTLFDLFILRRVQVDPLLPVEIIRRITIGIDIRDVWSSYHRWI